MSSGKILVVADSSCTTCSARHGRIPLSSPFLLPVAAYGPDSSAAVTTRTLTGQPRAASTPPTNANE